MYSYMVGKELESKGVKIDFRSLFEKAMLHDIEESQTGDIVRTMKYYSPEIRKCFADVSNSMMKDLTAIVFPKCSEDIFNAWNNCKDSSIEGEIVQTSDFLCVFAYSIEEIETGNRHMVPVCLDACKIFRTVADSFFNKELKDICDEVLLYIESRAV